MKKDRPQISYIEHLVAAGGSLAGWGNGDVILADSPRWPQARKAPGRRACDIETCMPGSPNTRTITIEHGAAFYGWERQADGSCVKKNYECNDGALDPI